MSSDKLKDTGSDYEAVRENGAGLIDLSSRGRIRVGGSEAVTFLNGLITNDMKTLAQNHWMPAVFPNVQGRLIGAVRVIRLNDDADQTPRFLLDTEAATHSAVLKTIARFTMAGDFRVTDVTHETSCISIQGKEALRLVRTVLDHVDEDLSRDGVVHTSWDDTPVIAIHATHTAEDGFDMFIDSHHAVELSNRLSKNGTAPITPETFETLRVEAGVPRFGLDMDDSNVVSETNLDDAISFTKGCYIGQEIIARIKYRGHVAKKLTGLTFDDERFAQAGAVIRSVDGKDIGKVTSVVFSPKLGRSIALGYVRFEHLASGSLLIVGDEQLTAKVTELPFVRGSWYGL